MEPLHPDFDASVAHTPETPALASDEALPVADQHPGAACLGSGPEQAVPVVQALAIAWSAETFDSLDLRTRLRAYLSENAFLRLSCRTRAIRVDGVELPDDSGLAQRLYAEDIVEILFKEGIEPREIDTLLGNLRQTDSIGFDDLATRLWEADLDHVTFRCADEKPVNHAREVEIFDLDRSGGVEADSDGADDAEVDLRADPREDAVVSAVASMDDFPRVEVENLPIHLKRAVFLSPEDTRATGSLAIPTPEESLNHLVYRLVDVYSSETDETIRHDTRAVLLGTIEALLREKRLRQVHELLLWLRSQVDEGVTAWDDLIGIVQECICAPQTVLLLGSVLNDREAAVEDVQAVRELLLIFDERTVHPLCRLLEHLESMEARKLVCQVLAVVAAGDPEALARRAQGQPWFVVRNLAYVLGRIGGEGVLPHLSQWALHRDERVRVEVARALGKVRCPESTEILCGLLNDDVYRVRQSAVWALSRRADPVALEHMRRLLFEDRDFRERPAEERDDYFRTYGRLVRDGSFQELLDIAAQRQILSRGWKLEMRRGAMIALAETGRSEARSVLQKNSEVRNSRLRDVALSALRDLRSRGKVQPGVRDAMQTTRHGDEAATVAWEEMGE